MWNLKRHDANELNLQNRKRLTHLESKGSILESPLTVGKLKVKETKLSKVIQLGSGRDKTSGRIFLASKSEPFLPSPGIRLPGWLISLY